MNMKLFTKFFRKSARVLAFYPSTAGLGFAVFEGRSFPINWGVKLISKNKNAVALKAAVTLMERYRPSVVVVEDYAGKDSRKCNRIERLIETIAQAAKERTIRIVRYSRSDIRQCFALLGAFTKYEIAQAISRELPEFEPYLPPVRKIWLPEHYRMSIFDAVSLVFTFYGCEETMKKAA